MDKIIRKILKEINKLDRWEPDGYPEEGFYMEKVNGGEYVRMGDLKEKLLELLIK